MPNGTPTKPIEPAAGESPVEIKVMPEEFYFKKMPRGPQISRPAEISQTPQIPQAPEAPKTLPPSTEVEVEKKPKTKLIILMAAVVIVLLAGAAYLFTQSLKTEKPKPTPPANVAANVPANVSAVNAPSVNAPPSPVCGNGICETGENSTGCPTDCPPPPPPAALPLAKDTDGDGLSDIEEGLFGAGLENFDTDADSYPDGLEVINLYNPTGFAPKKIEETDLVKIYSNSIYHYTIFYPTSWLGRALDETNQEVMFTSATGEFMEVIVEENSENLPLLDWYLVKSPGINPTEVGTVATKSGLSGVKSPDGLTVYFAAGDKIFVISYNIGIKTELNYKSIFEMMARSFKISL